jgi:hypothetical protein
MRRDGEGNVSSRVSWDQGAQDSTTQKEEFQVSKRGISKGTNKGLRLDLMLRSVCMYHNIV